jgi:hypothetical protein
MLILATPDASMGTVPLKIIAMASNAGKELTTTATAIAVQDTAEKTFKQGFLSVFDATPFTVDALTIAASMDQLQSGSVDVLVNRRPGFNGDVKLSAVGFVNGREQIAKSLDVKEVTVKNDTRMAQVKFSAKVDSELGTRPVLIRGEANDGGEQIVMFSQPVALTVTQIPFVLSAAPAKLALNLPRPGSTNFDDATLKVKVDRRGFPGEIPLALEGVPAGVKVDGTNVAANAGDATLTFAATEKAQPITNATITVLGAAMHNDRLYRHKTGGIKLTIAAPPVEVASTNAALTPKQP